MSSTLYGSHRARQLQHHMAPVVDLDAARTRLARATSSRPLRHTLLVRCATMQADEEIRRHIGIDESSSLDHLRRVIEVAFALPDDGPTPSRFTVEAHASGRVEPGTKIGVFLHEPGDILYFHWGLWRFVLEVDDVYPRDAATPDALCVAGAGNFGGTFFDVTTVNAQLMGPAVIENVLAGVRAEVSDIVKRSGSMDFVPLLKALDLARPDDVGADVSAVLDSLPRERSQHARDAFWSTVLALACFADEETTDAVVETTMMALYGVDFNGEPFTAERARHMCSGSLVRLASVGGYGARCASPVDRLDLFRALLRA